MNKYIVIGLVAIVAIAIAMRVEAVRDVIGLPAPVTTA